MTRTNRPSRSEMARRKKIRKRRRRIRNAIFYSLVFLLIFITGYYIYQRSLELKNTKKKTTKNQETTKVLEEVSTLPEEETTQAPVATTEVLPNLGADLRGIQYSTDPDANFNEDLVASSAILVDVTNGTILYEKDAYTKLAPASTTKLLTALIALRYLDPDQEIKVGKEINLIAEDSSTANLEIGDKLTVRELIQGLLMSSGNDAAYVLAVNTSRSIMGRMSVKKAAALFVDIMNNNVSRMGLEYSHFATPDGYDAEDQYTCAHDLAVIANQALENEVILEAVSTYTQYMEKIDETWTSTDQLLNPYSDYYMEEAIGLKTGSTTSAGKCFVGAAKDSTNTVVSVVLGSDEPGRWTDSRALLSYGLAYDE